MLEIKTYLCKKDSTIAEFIMCISYNGLSIENFKLLDIDFKNVNFLSEYTFLNWLLQRCMSSQSINYNRTIPSLFNFENTRIKDSSLVLSLTSNAANLSDKYWLNLETDTLFVFHKRNINFLKKDYKCVDFFSNISTSTHFNDVIIQDRCYENNINIDLRNPLFSTDGDSIKRWIYTTDSYHFEKRVEKMKQIKKFQILLISNRAEY